MSDQFQAIFVLRTPEKSMNAGWNSKTHAWHVSSLASMKAANHHATARPQGPISVLKIFHRIYICSFEIDRENITIYLHFWSIVNTEMFQIVGSRSQERTHIVIAHSQHNCSWWPNNTRYWDISSQGIDIVFLDHFGLSIRWVKMSSLPSLPW